MITELPRFFEYMVFEDTKGFLKEDAPEWAKKEYEEYQEEKRQYDKQAGYLTSV